MPNFFINVKEKGAKKANRNIKGLTGSMRGLATSAIAVASPILAIGAAYKAISGAVSIGKDFEQSMANLKAVTGAAGVQFTELEKMAKKLGGSTKFTASEVAGLATEYGKLGFASTEILNVAEDTLFLAGAVGAELPRAAEVAGATLKAFGIDAKDTARVTNLMAASFSGSALDMEKFAESMKMVAPVAKSAGFEIEDTTAMLGTLANVGIHGSLAGTGLKNVFLQMSKEGSKLSKALGGPVKSVKDLAPALMKLKKEGIGLTAAMDMVGKISAPAFLALVEGSSSMQMLKDEITGTNKAAEMYAIQQDTLKGRTDELKSATEGLGIAMFDHLAPSLEDAVEGFTDLVGAATSWLQIPTSEKLREEQSELNALVSTLEKYNDDEETRKRIIGEIQQGYPDFLKNIDIEKATTKEVADELERYNKHLDTKIEKLAEQETIKRYTDKLVEYQTAVFNARVEIERLTKKQEEEGGFNKLSGAASQTTNDLNMTKAGLEIYEQKLADTKIEMEEFKNILSTMAESDVPMIFSPDFEPPEDFSMLLNPEDVEKELSLLDRLGNAKKDYAEKIRKYNEEMTTDELANYAIQSRSASDAMKSVVKAKSMEAISGFIAAIFKTVPFPFNLVLAAGAGGAVNSIMDNALKSVPSFATGGDFVTSGPQMIMVGDNAGGRERVEVTPLSSPNINGPEESGNTYNISVSGNVLTQDFVEDELAESIRTAVRRGTDFGIS